MLKHFRKLKSTLNQDLFLNDMIYKEIDFFWGKASHELITRYLKVEPVGTGTCKE